MPFRLLHDIHTPVWPQPHDMEAETLNLPGLATLVSLGLDLQNGLYLRLIVAIRVYCTDSTALPLSIQIAFLTSLLKPCIDKACMLLDTAADVNLFCKVFTSPRAA